MLKKLKEYCVLYHGKSVPFIEALLYSALLGYYCYRYSEKDTGNKKQVEEGLAALHYMRNG